MNDRPGAAHLADVVAVLEQPYDLRWAESWDARARSDRSAPRDDLRVHLEVPTSPRCIAAQNVCTPSATVRSENAAINTLT